MTLALTRGSATKVPGDGFFGLFLDPLDPLFSASLADLGWTYASTDSAGHAAILFDAAPAGVTVTLFVQAYDFDGKAFGAPIAVELLGV